MWHVSANTGSLIQGLLNGTSVVGTHLACTYVKTRSYLHCLNGDELCLRSKCDKDVLLGFLIQMLTNNDVLYLCSKCDEEVLCGVLITLISLVRII